jgi:acetyl esterase/lipase
MSTTTPERPAIDPELSEQLASFPEFAVLSAETLPLMRPYATAPIEPLLASRDVVRQELTIPTSDGHDLPITVLAPAERSGLSPAVLWLHGGGMVMGDRFSQIDIPLEWLDELGAVVVSADYRLAPEANGTTLVEDAYAALEWVADHAADLGIDSDRIVVAGTSAGGGIAAGLTLLARDRGNPAIAAQVLVCPMLDHRNATTSAQQFTAPAVWSRESNAFAWHALLGDAPEVSPYASPATASDLSGLPPTYIDAGTAEVFRDEDVEYASRIWAAGGQAELHVWAGGFHGFDALFPDASLSRSARSTRTEWLRRTLQAMPGI